MRIFQISDLHIAEENENPQGVDVRANFVKVVGEIKKYSPDFVVISGDLSFREGNKNIYRWISEQIIALDLPVYVIPGNHDNSLLLAEQFHPDKATSSDGKLYYFIKKGANLFLFLDTWDGCIGTQQFKWMDSLVKRYTKDRLFIFMHHPPVLANVPHMDGKHAFREIEKFNKLFDNSATTIHVFTGHYHFQKSVQTRNFNIHLCPSTFFHLDGDKETFRKDHAVPGFQIIDIEKDKVAVHAHFLF